MWHRTLWQRESETPWLMQAVEAYRAALLECSRERAPLDWALVQNNLGVALARLAESESAPLGWRRPSRRIAKLSLSEPGSARHSNGP